VLNLAREVLVALTSSGAPGIAVPVKLGILVAVILAAGCATIQRREARQTESLLAEAGFQRKPADTADKVTHLGNLAPHKIVSFTKDGKQLYAYADPTGCKCLLVGDAQAYQRYQQLVDAPETAVEADIARKVDEEDADDAGTDWEYSNGPLWW
jgi:hypothetical protein